MSESKVLKRVLRLSRKQNSKLYTSDYRLTRLRTFKVLPGTKTFYVEAKKFFESAGFTRLGDYRISSMPRHTDAYRTPIRFYLAPGRETVADAYYLQAPLKRHMEMGFSGIPTPLTYDFTTEFEDGGFLETSNGEAASFVELPKSIQRVFLTAYSPPKKILAAHRRALAKQKKLGRVPVRVTNEPEMLASAVRLHLLKTAFRHKVGHGTMKEVKSIKKRMDDTANNLENMFSALLELAAGATGKKRT